MSWLRRIIEGFKARLPELARLMTLEMGAPVTFATERQATVALFHFEEAARVLAQYQFEQWMGAGIVRREPISVCGLITPWNWPLNQVASKVAPALATGCTVVLKPSEIAPLSAMLLADIIHEAGFPRGVFNLVNGDGPTVGEAIASHSEIDMVSFTGSTAAGIRVAKLAADTVKRVAQELGGKSANIILPDADLKSAVISAFMPVTQMRVKTASRPRACWCPAHSARPHSPPRVRPLKVFVWVARWIRPRPWGRW